MKLFVCTFNDGYLLEACARIDEDNVLTIQMVPNKVGQKTRVQFGLHEYGGNMPSYDYDHAYVTFLNDKGAILSKGEIQQGEFECFLRELPAAVKIHNQLIKLEYAKSEPIPV